MKSAIASLLLLSRQALAGGGSWTYADMGHWADDYSMCDNNDESPIDIVTSKLVYDVDVCTAEFDWDVDYTKTTFKLTNNGRTLVLQPVEESTVDPEAELSSTLFDESGTEYMTLSGSDNAIATFPNYFQPEDSEHDSFCLHSMHFHWGLTDETGAEHLIDGHQYALELHFVHYSCAHSSLGSTLSGFPNETVVDTKKANGEDVHQLGVVGIFFDVVEESNPAFDVIFENVEEYLLPTTSSTAQIVSGLNLSDMIPEDLTTAGYYAYEGSLTTPPCTDIVRWHVMKSRSWIGAEQMEKFRKLLKYEGGQVAPNFRDVMENVNTVYGCMEEKVSEGPSEETTRIIVWCLAVVSIITPVILGIVCCYQAKKEREGMEKPDVDFDH